MTVYYQVQYIWIWSQLSKQGSCFDAGCEPCFVQHCCRHLGNSKHRKLHHTPPQDFQDCLEGWVKEAGLVFGRLKVVFFKSESCLADQVLEVCSGASDWCEEHSWQRWHVSLPLPPSLRRWSHLSQSFQNSTFLMHPLNTRSHWKQMTVEARRGKKTYKSSFFSSGWGFRIYFNIWPLLCGMTPEN